MSLIDKIKAVFNEGEEVTVQFVDVKTDDGRILRVSDLAVDGTVVEITEEGEAELEDGTYVLDTGASILVEAGKIVEVKEPEADEEEAPAEPEATEEEMAKVDEKFYDVFLKDGGPAHVINTKEGEMNVGDKMTIEGIEAAAGEYELNSGETLTVGENGVIDAIASVDSNVEEVIEEIAVDVPEDATEEDVQGIVNNLKNLVKQIKELKSQFSELKTQFETIETENKELKEEVSKFAGTPSAEPTKTKVDFKKADRNAKLDFFSRK